jgi:histone H3/H4
MMKILPSFGAIHKARQKSEQEAEFTRKFLESTKLELEMRVADKSDHLWEKRILNEWPIVRVKRIMKRPTIFGSPRMVSANAVYLMAYATRVFLRLITARAAQIMIAEKRTTLLVRDIIAAVKDSSNCDFLLDIVDEWERSHMSTSPASKRGRKANEARAALSNQGLKPAPSAQGIEPAPSTLLPLPPTGSGVAHQERDAYRSLPPLALPMPGTGWETPQAGSFDLGAELGAELRQWGSESDCLLSTGIAIDWGAAQLALEPDSFELDGELAHWATGD